MVGRFGTVSCEQDIAHGLELYKCVCVCWHACVLACVCVCVYACACFSLYWLSLLVAMVNYVLFPVFSYTYRVCLQGQFYEKADL